MEPTNRRPRTLGTPQLAKFNEKKTLRSTDKYASTFRTDPSSTLLCQHKRKKHLHAAFARLEGILAELGETNQRDRNPSDPPAPFRKGGRPDPGRAPWM